MGTPEEENNGLKVMALDLHILYFILIFVSSACPCEQSFFTLFIFCCQ